MNPDWGTPLECQHCKSRRVNWDPLAKPGGSFLCPHGTSVSVTLPQRLPSTPKPALAEKYQRTSGFIKYIEMKSNMKGFKNQTAEEPN